MRTKIPRKPKIREKDSIEISIATPQPIWKGDIKHKLVNCVLNNNFIPEIVSSNIMEVFFDHKKGLPFSEENLAKVMQYLVPQKSSIGDIYLNQSITLKSKKPKKFDFYFGFMGGRSDHWHNRIYITLETFKDKEIIDNTKNLFSDMCLLVAPDFARIQFYTGEERHTSSLVSTIIEGKDDVIISSNKHLMKFLPDIYAITVFGKPYIDLFGRDKLLSSPCYKVKELPNGLIKLQLGEHVFDERGSKEALNNVRKKVKEHLNNNAFLDPDKPVGFKYNVPEFDFSAIRAPIEMPEEESK